MSVQISPVNTGITANDGTGDTIQNAFIKTNGNFSNVATAINQLQSNAVVAASVTNLTVTGNLTVSSNITGNNISANVTVYGNISGVTAAHSGNVSIGGFLTLGSALQYANLTTSQIASITPTLRGMTVYNYSTGNVQVYNGTKWANVTLS